MVRVDGAGWFGWLIGLVYLSSDRAQTLSTCILKVSCSNALAKQITSLGLQCGNGSSLAVNAATGTTGTFVVGAVRICSNARFDFNDVSCLG